MSRTMQALTTSSGHIPKSLIALAGRPLSKPILRYSYLHKSSESACLLTLLPKVTKLCGPEPLTKYLVLAVVALQIVCAYSLRSSSFASWQYLGTAYLIGATANQNLFLAIHEISHNLAFKSPLANRLLAIFANLPIGIPYSASFRVSLPQSVYRVSC